MRPTKEGQIVKFHTPFPDEDPNQLYLVKEMKDGAELARADIQILNSDFGWSLIKTVPLDDLEIVEVSTSDLIGHFVTINKSDCSQVEGKVIKVNEQKIMLDLSKGIKGVETNVYLTIVDKQGNEHTGSLFVN